MDFREKDPAARAYRGWRRAIRNYCVVLVAMLLVAWFVGVPHVQGDYRTYSPRTYCPRKGLPGAKDKSDAWYLSVTGWKHVRAGQYGHVEGCPGIMFIPLQDCL